MKRIILLFIVTRFIQNLKSTEVFKINLSSKLVNCLNNEIPAINEIVSKINTTLKEENEEDTKDFSERILGVELSRLKESEKIEENPEETPDPPENLNEEEYAEWLDEQTNSKEFHEQLAEEAAFQGVASQRKPVEQIIQKNNKFFCNLSNITHIHVYGMSFSEVDAPYLRKIAKEAKNAEWEFSDYKKDNERKIKKFIQDNGIGMHRIIELNDILENKQLDIDFL